MAAKILMFRAPRHPRPPKSLVLSTPRAFISGQRQGLLRMTSANQNFSVFVFVGNIFRGGLSSSRPSPLGLMRLRGESFYRHRLKQSIHPGGNAKHTYCQGSSYSNPMQVIIPTSIENVQLGTIRGLTFVHQSGKIPRITPERYLVGDRNIGIPCKRPVPSAENILVISDFIC